MSGIVNDGWGQIEAEYPYHISFDAPDTVRAEGTTNPITGGDEELIYHLFMSIGLSHKHLYPPLYHDLLSLPLTDRELETRLEVDVAP